MATFGGRLRALAVGGPPRLDPRDRTGVAAQTPSVGVVRRQTLSLAPQNLQVSPWMTLAANARNPLLGRTGRGLTAHRPNRRMGPVPKLSTGTGHTAGGLGASARFAPGGFNTQGDVTPAAGLEMMPYRRDSFDAAPRGIPLRGVGAVSGADFVPTYKPHDWAWVPRFFKHGRMPGPWQETAFGPGYRYLQPTQTPVRYNMGNSVHLARPLSPNAYFLGYQTSSDVYARFGASGPGVRPLGF